MSAYLMGLCYRLDFSAFATPEVRAKSLQDIAQALADHAHDDGRSCYPSVGYLSWKTGYSKRTVQRALTVLDENKVIDVVTSNPDKRRKGGRKPTTWQLHLDRVPEKAPYIPQMGDDSLAPLGSESVAIGTPAMPALSPEPSEEPLEGTTYLPPTVEEEPMTKGPREHVWDGLEHLFGKPGTREAEKHRGKVVGAIVGAGVDTAEGVADLAAEYRKTFSADVVMTQDALMKHADLLAHQIKSRVERRAAAPCEFCGVGGGRHSAECPEAEAA